MNDTAKERLEHPVSYTLVLIDKFVKNAADNIRIKETLRVKRKLGEISTLDSVKDLLKKENAEGLIQVIEDLNNYK